MAKGKPEEEKRQKIGQQEGARSSLAGRPCLYIIYFNDCDYPERSPQPKLNWAEPSFLFFFVARKAQPKSVLGNHLRIASLGGKGREVGFQLGMPT